MIILQDAYQIRYNHFMNKIPSQEESIPDEFRNSMRHWATGVTIVSSVHAGVTHGMTVSSFTSVSISPPLVLVSLQKEARTHDLIKGSGSYGVTILSAHHQPISNLFAGKEIEGANRFDGLEIFTLLSGSPFLKAGLAFFDCTLKDSYQAGPNTVLFGEVIAARTNLQVDKGDPLIYYNQDYQRLNK
jgi:flavin reductase (DIM6/NTAB) family NADH-FMN oxidoreductase RutF